MEQSKAAAHTLLERNVVRSDDDANKIKNWSCRQRLLFALVATLVAIALGVGIAMVAWTWLQRKAANNEQAISDTIAPSEANQFLRSHPPTSSPAMTAMPTQIQSEHLTPSLTPSSLPSKSPTALPSTAPSGIPSRDEPKAPSHSPTYSPVDSPTLDPTNAPSTTNPTHSPTDKPTPAPLASRPTDSVTVVETTGESIFYGIGDVPYTARQAIELADQMTELPKDAEFVIHVGDLLNRKENEPCPESDYSLAADLLRLSHAPVFVVLGDNDWNDCINRDEAFGFWKKHLLKFESRHWNHSFDIIRQPRRLENFAFAHNGALFIGLNIVGGAVQSEGEWYRRLTDEVSWTIGVIRNYRDALAPKVGRVLIFAQAYPSSHHRAFFEPFQAFVRDELQNRLPILYLHGDLHYWLYEPNFYDQSSFLRIMVTGQTVDPPVRIGVRATGDKSSTKDAFEIDRRL
jgi:predicted phosphodiesterase